MADQKAGKTYGFRKGAMYISDEKGQIHIRAWPDPASHTRLWHNKWKPYAPEFRLISPRKSTRRATKGDNGSQLSLDISCEKMVPDIPSSPSNKNWVFRTLRSTLPDTVADAVEAFRNHQWHLIRFTYQIGDCAMDLLDSNPVLAFLLANHKVYSRMMSDPERAEKARGIAGLKQREILKRLKYPNTKAMVNLVKKLRPESVSPDSLEALRVCVTDDVIARQLARIETINAGVLGIITNDKLAGVFNGRLLREVSTIPKEHYYPFAMRTLEEVCYMCRIGRPRREPPVFSSLKRLEEFHDEISESFVRISGKKLRYCKVPKPPVPGTETIVPLNTPLRIQKEGTEQHNCVASYAPRIERGGVYVYKVLAPERATLEIVRDAGGTWRMGQLRADRNRPVSAETERTVEAWLETNSVSA